MHNCQVLAALPGLKHACMAGSLVAKQVKSGQHSEGDDITGRSVSHMHGFKQRDWQFCNKHAHIAVHVSGLQQNREGMRCGETNHGLTDDEGTCNRSVRGILWQEVHCSICGAQSEELPRDALTTFLPAAPRLFFAGQRPSPPNLIHFKTRAAAMQAAFSYTEVCTNR